MIKLMHQLYFRATPLVLIICMLISILTVLSIQIAVSSLAVVYPKVVLTVVFIPTVVDILTVVSSLYDCSQQHHNQHSYFHIIVISAYPAVREKMYAYINMFGRNDLIPKTNSICWKGRQSLQACNYACEGKKPPQDDSFGKGHCRTPQSPPEAHMIKYQGRCRRALWSKFLSLFL